MTGPVDLRRLAERHRHILKVTHHNDKIIHVNCHAEDNGPLAPHQPDFLYGHILRDNSRVKQHHDDKEHHQHSLADQAGTCQHISCQRRQYNI